MCMWVRVCECMCIRRACAHAYTYTHSHTCTCIKTPEYSPQGNQYFISIDYLFINLLIYFCVCTCTHNCNVCLEAKTVLGSWLLVPHCGAGSRLYLQPCSVLRLVGPRTSRESPVSSSHLTKGVLRLQTCTTTRAVCMHSEDETQVINSCDNHFNLWVTPAILVCWLWVMYFTDAKY